MPGDEQFDGDVGRPDLEALHAVRRVFEREELLVVADETEIAAPLLNPTLRIVVRDGIGAAEGCRFDIRWYDSGAYNVHHVDDEGVNWRFDYHPKRDAPDQHFHPPPDAPTDDVTESCIAVTEPVLVARAVRKLWRRAYETGSLDGLNDAQNPPEGG